MWERVYYPLKQVRVIAWIKALIQAVITLHAAFLNFRALTQRNLTILPSKRILQWWLNELFDPVARQIEIKDYDQLDTLFIFLESENRPVYLPTFIGSSNYDFEVCIPCAYASLEPQIRGFLDAYKLATKRYLITYTGDCG